MAIHCVELMEENRDNIEGKVQFMDSISIGIIELLKQKNDFTSEQLGKILSVSERTVRNRIKEINETLINHGGVIVSQRGHGYHLDIINASIFEEWLKSIHEDNEAIPNSPEERANYIINYLLNQKTYVLMDDICDLLYIARNTLTADLKKVEQVIYKYNLSIERRPNYGIKVAGKEADKRLCIIDYLMRNQSYMTSKLKNASAMMVFGDVLSRVFHNCEYVTSVENYNDIKNMMYVTYKRARNGFDIDFDDTYKKEILGSIPANVVEMTDKIVASLGAEYSVLNDQNEKLYIAMQIAGRGNIINGQRSDTGTDIDEMVMNMLLEVKNGLKVDLSNDFDLLMVLRNHMAAFDIRMKYFISIDNPLLAEVKKKYSLAYALASYACNYLSEYYDKRVSEDEIGYMAIIFELALEKKDKPIRKKNVVIVCASGNATSRFFVYKYKEVFGQYLDKVYECSAAEIRNFDFAGRKIDYCFTTLDAEFDLPVPCYRISVLPTEGEIQKYQRIFDMDNLSYLLEYYDEKLFIPHLKGTSKEEVLENMVAFIAQRKTIPADFLKMVISREKHGLTSFGNMAATPHPERTCTEENIVCVGILDEPVNWGSNDVQLIILLSLSTDVQQDSRIFIETLTTFISDEDAVRELLEVRTFDHLLGLLTRNNEHR